MADSAVDTCASRSLVALPADLPEVGVAADPGALLRSAHGEEPEGDPGKEALLVVLGGEALHRRAGPDPAWVPADEVETCTQLGREQVEKGGKIVGARAARAAGVEEERAEAVGRVGRPMSDDGKVDGLALRVAVVQRHLGGGAVEALLTGSVAQGCQSSTGTVAAAALPATAAGSDRQATRPASATAAVATCRQPRRRCVGTVSPVSSGAVSGTNAAAMPLFMMFPPIRNEVSPISASGI